MYPLLLSTNLPLERGRFLRFALVASDSVLSSTGQEMRVIVLIVTGTFHHHNSLKGSVLARELVYLGIP